MKNQVAVTGEGPTDYGCRIFDKRSGQYQWQWGPVIEILEKCRKAAENETEVEWVPVEKEEIKKIKLLRTEKNLKGRAIPARKFRNYCQANQIQYGIFYADADREVFCRLAQWIRTEILRERCPLSFKPFYQDFLEMCKTMKDASKGEVHEIHPFIGPSHWKAGQ